MNLLNQKQVRLFLLAFLFSSLYSFAQINFESGYFISNNGDRVDCFIKNVGWNDNPNQFEYKLTETSEAKVGTIEAVREFGILDFLKYERHLTKIDRSSDIVSRLSSQRAPEYSVKKVFLKVLVDAKVDLLVFNAKDVKRFFTV